MTLLDEVQELDRRCAQLQLFEARLRRLHFAPELRDRTVLRCRKRRQILSRQMESLLIFVRKDQALCLLYDTRNQLGPNDEKREREQPQRIDHTISSTSHKTGDLQKLTKHEQALSRAERRAIDAYQDAIWYYKEGTWRQDNVSQDMVREKLDELRLCMTHLRNIRQGVRKLIASKAAEARGAMSTTQYSDNDEPRIPGRPPRFSDTSDLGQANEFQAWLDEIRESSSHGSGW